VFDPLMDFVSNSAEDTDIFCFQEVFDTPTLRKNVDDFYRANLFSELKRVLPEHDGYFAPSEEGYGFVGPVDFPIQWGVAMFVKRPIEIVRTGDTYIFGSYNSRWNGNSSSSRNLQYVCLNVDGQDYTLAHFHGLWKKDCGKDDLEERIEQSHRVKEFLDRSTGKKVLCGDFNLSPETESLAILEEGLINLIKVQGITTTRSSYYPKPDRFADYVLVSPDVNVKQFEVPQIEVSDHLPLFLDFS